jgi:uncharacterized membrane-anchored protein YitT (DUF2179 family)
MLIVYLCGLMKSSVELVFQPAALAAGGTNH